MTKWMFFPETWHFQQRSMPAPTTSLKAWKWDYLCFYLISMCMPHECSLSNPQRALPLLQCIVLLKLFWTPIISQGYKKNLILFSFVSSSGDTKEKKKTKHIVKKKCCIAKQTALQITCNCHTIEGDEKRWWKQKEGNWRNYSDAFSLTRLHSKVLFLMFIGKSPGMLLC